MVLLNKVMGHITSAFGRKSCGMAERSILCRHLESQLAAEPVALTIGL